MLDLFVVLREIVFGVFEFEFHPLKQGQVGEDLLECRFVLDLG